MRALLAEYGMAVVLVLLCAYFTWATWGVQYPEGAGAARELAKQMPSDARAILIVSHKGPRSDEFVKAASDALAPRSAEVVLGEPFDLRQKLDEGAKPDLIIATHESSQWLIVKNLTGVRVLSPTPYKWARFLTEPNLIAIADRLVIIAVIAVGMTMVIITGGIDLSVGSLIALSAVVAAMVIRRAGGEQAGALAITGGFAAGIAVCALSGLLCGVIITRFDVPPFVVTLAMMLIARGVALLLTDGIAIYGLPDGMIWLGRGRFFGVPNIVILLAVLYMLAHVVMSRSVPGRWIYAIGSNRQAAYLAAVPIKRVVVMVYGVCGAMAGLGGVIEASRLKTGSPIFGDMVELSVIAAVVVGGTSLSGGRGKILGTLIGVLLIAVIENGMNLRNVSPYTQRVTLGLVILGAVMLERARKGRVREFV